MSVWRLAYPSPPPPTPHTPHPPQSPPPRRASSRLFNEPCGLSRANRASSAHRLGPAREPPHNTDRAGSFVFEAVSAP